MKHHSPTPEQFTLNEKELEITRLGSLAVGGAFFYSDRYGVGAQEVFAMAEVALIAVDELLGLDDSIDEELVEDRTVLVKLYDELFPYIIEAEVNLLHEQATPRTAKSLPVALQYGPRPPSSALRRGIRKITRGFKSKLLGKNNT